MFRRARLIAYENGAQVNSRNRYSSKYLLSNLLVCGAIDCDAIISKILELEEIDRKSTRLNSSHLKLSRMPSSA